MNEGTCECKRSPASRISMRASWIWVEPASFPFFSFSPPSLSKLDVSPMNQGKIKQSNYGTWLSQNKGIQQSLGWYWPNQPWYQLVSPIPRRMPYMTPKLMSHNGPCAILTMEHYGADNIGWQGSSCGFAPPLRSILYHTVTKSRLGMRGVSSLGMLN